MTDEEYLKKLGQRIIEIRKSKNISQIDLSYDCGFEKSTMSRIESGRANITIKVLRKIAKYLDVNEMDLLNF